jgi:hypothetical protein
MASIADDAGPPPVGAARKVRSRFFANSSIVIAALIVVTFARTYFVPLATGSAQFIMLRHVHGAVFFAWLALYVVQSNLVAAGRVRLHRELGQAVVAVSGMMLPLGFWMAVREIEEKLAQRARFPFEVAAYNFFDLSLFACSMAGAVYFATRELEWHRRLVYVAAICLLGPAISRWIDFVPLKYPLLDASPNIVADLFLVALALHDWRARGRVHPVTIVAAAILVPFNFLEPLIARSATWSELAPHIFGFR